MIWKFMCRKKAVPQTGWVFVYHPSEIGNYGNVSKQFPFTCASPTPPVIPQEKVNNAKSAKKSRICL